MQLQWRLYMHLLCTCPDLTQAKRVTAGVACEPQVGVLCLLRWFGHFIALGVYTLLDATVRPLAQRSKSFRLRRCAPWAA